MRILKIITFLILCTVFMGSCTNKEEVSLLNIPNQNNYNKLIIEEIDKDNPPTVDSKEIVNEENIKLFMNNVTQIKVVKNSQKEMIKKVEKLYKQGGYLFILVDSKTQDIEHNEQYIVMFLKDGSVLCRSGSNNPILYSSKVKHIGMLKYLKAYLNINF